MGDFGEMKLAQMVTAVSYLADVLEEGSLVERYDAATREEMALVLRLLLEKVGSLPQETPSHLVQAAAVRAIIAASEEMAAAARQQTLDRMEKLMREATTAAALQGHSLGEWAPTAAGDMRYMAACQVCRGVLYVNEEKLYSLLPEICKKA